MISGKIGVQREERGCGVPLAAFIWERVTQAPRACKMSFEVRSLHFKKRWFFLAAAAACAVLLAAGRLALQGGETVPILMYHAFTEDPNAATSEVTYIKDFEEQIAALKKAGYHSVFYQELVDYVYRGKELPENPIVITMDDGYQSDLDLAAPVLEREGFRATIAVIGCSVGKDTYKDTGTPINPHFALEDAAPYVESGVLDIQTHSYDMHQVKKLDGEDCRFGVLRMEGETEEAYTETLSADFLRSKEQIESSLDVTCNVYTYPYGVCDELSESILRGLGIQVSVTVEPGVNRIAKDRPESLYQLKRINVAGGMSAAGLLDTLARGGES